ncbi:MAG: hypothetical protein HY744_05690 [Deltaproteobacteria bacterium]|nr:hypothetical protein [Deltaproteobacteria bacterium]
MLRAHTLLALLVVCACGGQAAVEGAAGGGTGGAGGGAGGHGQGGGGPSSGCPESAPQPGTPCAPAEMACTYGDSVEPWCRTRYACKPSGWTPPLPLPSACAGSPPPGCPVPAPASHSQCPAELVGTQCIYASASELCRCTDMECGGPCEIIDPPQWRCFGPPAEPGCPAVVPNDGAACSQPGLECSYLGGPCGGGTLARCEQGAWHWIDNVTCPA